VPTPLAATRLLPPDSLMAALDPAAQAQLRAASLLQTRYGQRTDPQSAHEILGAKIQAARDAAAAASGVPAGPAGGVPAPGGGTMTPAQYQREIQREAKQQAQEIARAQREAERQRKAAAREAAQAQRQRERVVETGVRTAGRVLTSRAGQSLLRGVFGTLFGGGRTR